MYETPIIIACMRAFSMMQLTPELIATAHTQPWASHAGNSHTPDDGRAPAGEGCSQAGSALPERKLHQGLPVRVQQVEGEHAHLHRHLRMAAMPELVSQLVRPQALKGGERHVVTRQEKLERLRCSSWSQAAPPGRSCMLRAAAYPIRSWWHRSHLHILQG